MGVKIFKFQYQKIKLNMKKSILNLFIALISVFTGTYIAKSIGQNFFKKIIEILALFSAIILLMNNFDLLY